MAAVAESRKRTAADAEIEAEEVEDEANEASRTRIIPFNPFGESIEQVKVDPFEVKLYSLHFRPGTADHYCMDWTQEGTAMTHQRKGNTVKWQVVIREATTWKVTAAAAATYSPADSIETCPFDFHPLTGKIACALPDRLRIWDLTTAGIDRDGDADGLDDCRMLRFNPDGTKLAGLIFQKKATVLKIWETESLALLHEFKWANNEQRFDRMKAKVEFSHDSALVIVYDEIHTLRVWSVVSGEQTGFLEKPSQYRYRYHEHLNLKCHWDKPWALLAGKRNLMVRNYCTMEEVWAPSLFLAHVKEVTFGTLAPAGEAVQTTVIICYKDKIEIWGLESKTLLVNIKSEVPLFGLSFVHTTGRLFINYSSGDEKCLVRAEYDLTTGEVLKVIATDHYLSFLDYDVLPAMVLM